MWAVCKEELLTYPKIQTRTCIDTRKEPVQEEELLKIETLGKEKERLIKSH